MSRITITSCEKASEQERDGFQDIAFYIRAHPLGAGRVADKSALRKDPFLGCLLPGFPEVSIWDEDDWSGSAGSLPCVRLVESPRSGRA